MDRSLSVWSDPGYTWAMSGVSDSLLRGSSEEMMTEAPGELIQQIGCRQTLDAHAPRLYK